METIKKKSFNKLHQSFLNIENLNSVLFSVIHIHNVVQNRRNSIRLNDNRDYARTESQL